MTRYKVVKYNNPAVNYPDFAVVGQFMPSYWDVETIAKEFTDWAKDLGFPLTGGELSIRTPWANAQIAATDPTVTAWHHDDRGYREGLLLWSSTIPTEFKHVGEDKQIVGIKAFDVVYCHNQKVMHRAPAEQGENRWFIRAVISLKKTTFVRRESISIPWILTRSV